ncbi:MAG: hydantoinase/oxoprolinase family protein [Syntrophales bacterium]
MERKEKYLVACDAGGTMTDLFVVNPDGEFVVGKAATTPWQESIGFLEALDDAYELWGIDYKKEAKNLVPEFASCAYTGTSILNAMITRHGVKVGMIVNKGFEQSFWQTRGSETTLGYATPEIFHTVYRRRKESYVPFRRIRGVTGKIDVHGNEIIPFYEHDARTAVRELLDEGIESLAICFLASFANPTHEIRMVEIAKEIMKEAGIDIPIITSHEICPVINELPRMNTVVVQAFAAEPARKQLLDIEKELKKEGFKYPLQMVLSYGTVADIRWPRMVEATMSGPVGGILGAKYLGEQVGIENFVCSDVGGTSFDAGIVLKGRIPLNREPEFQRMYLSLPMLDVQSIGAGAGTYIRLDEYTNRIKLGPDSAGGTPGPVCYDRGNLIPTICDCNLILGRLNPDYFLGGKVKLNVDLAFKIFKEKISDVLAMDMYKCAEGIVNLIDANMRRHLTGSITGHDPREFVLIGFGGGAGLHLSNYAADISWKGVCTVPWAAGFSAFGCAAMDFAHRYVKSVDLMIPDNPDEARRTGIAKTLNNILDEHMKAAVDDFAREGFQAEDVKYAPFFLMKYFGQIMDIEVLSPTGWLNSPADVTTLLTEFEKVYSETYTMVGLAPGTPYQITQAGVVASVANKKPKIMAYALEGKEPPKKAFKETRRVYHGGEWRDAKIYELDEIRPGNNIKGTAILEAPAYTLYIPPDKEVDMDKHKLIWLKRRV